jgi:outer membrane protein OmpA-like peptidoglycan-associated protein
MNRLAPLVLALVVAAGCSGPPALNPRVEAAQAALQAAREMGAPEAAPVAYARAQEAVERAESARLLKEDVERVDHLAYLALQRAQIAQATTRANAATAEIEGLREERQQVQLEARTAEAEAAQRRAEEAQRLAQLERQQAERERAEAERRRQEAIAAQQEAEAARARAEAALARAQELADQVNDLQAQLTNRGLVLTLGDVLFDTGRAGLKAGGLRAVDRLATFLADYPERTVLVEGFTDATGSDATNQALSERRADAVRQALLERGVADARIRTRGYGEAYPVATNDTAAGRQENRRVEVVISDDDGVIPDRTGG